MYYTYTECTDFDISEIASRAALNAVCRASTQHGPGGGLCQES